MANKDFKPEFEALGLDRVRHQVMMRRWDADKLAAARIWVESQDAQSWLAGRSDGPPASADRKKQTRRWIIYVATGFGAAYAGARLFRGFRQ